MKFRKIIATITISLLLICGMSTVVSAGFFPKSEITKEIIDEEGTMEKLTLGLLSKEIFVITLDEQVDIIKRVNGYYPLNLDDFGDEFKQEGLRVRFTGKIDIPRIISIDGLPLFFKGYMPIRLDSIKVVKEEPKLSFDISLKKLLVTGEPISVEAAFENIGNVPVMTDEMSPLVSSLDLVINTPDGNQIHYVGDKERRLPNKIALKPGDSITYEFEDITADGLFGNDEIESYRFINGEYAIEGRYDTKIVPVDDKKTENVDPENKDTDVIGICYVSKKYTFEITDEIPETVELVLQTEPLFISNEVFSYSPEPENILAILDGKLHLKYDLNTDVTISVNQRFEDLIFEKYSADASGSDPTVTITMDSDKLVIANYFQTLNPPNACFRYEPEEIFVGTEITFDSSCSNDDKGEIQSYDWDFGDGVSSEEKNPIHSFEKEGEYTVKLTVTDVDGLKGSHSQLIAVKDDVLPETGTISGKITEKTIVEVKEKPIPEAKIEVISTGRTKEDKYSTVSDEEGNYELEVSIGEYLVIASKEGYKEEMKKVLVEAATCNEVNFQLTKVEETNLKFDIEVNAEFTTHDSLFRIQASITNNGQNSIEVSKISKLYDTISLQIRTPDGKVLISDKTKAVIAMPPKVTIEAGKTYSESVEFNLDDFVIISIDGDKTSESHDFHPGTYVIKGIYTSWGPRDGRWVGRLVSEEKIMTIN